MPWKRFEWREKRGDSHTFDLIKLFTYPHMPPGPFAGHMKDGPGQRRERENTPRTWHSARESSMTRREEKRKWPAGISQSELQKSSQLFILAGVKRAVEQVVQSGASGATEEGEKGGEEEEEDDKRNPSLPNAELLMHYFWTWCLLFFWLPGASFACDYYA